METTTQIDRTHDAALATWVESARGHAQFPIQNLPMGVFATGDSARIGCAIGDQVLDVAAALSAGLLPDVDTQTARAMTGETLNAWMALDATQRRTLRAGLSRLLEDGSPTGAVAERHRGAILHAQDACRMLLPAQVGDYTDYYAGIHHAYNCGVIFRPELPLQPNYKHLPVAYHGRASTLMPSGMPVHRPSGQARVDAAGGPQPVYGPTARLDYELELAMWVGPGNALATRIDIARAAEHVAGFGLLNDWSARDIQAWESAPLGPFLGKNFMTSVSPWIITSDAMAPFRAARMPREASDPQPLDYLDDAVDAASGGLAIALEVHLSTRRMREAGLAPHRLSQGDTGALWWTPAQMVAHHTAGGCNLRPGDLIGTGTISMPDGQECGCLLEMTHGGKRPVQLPNGEVRSFLEDGDEVILSGTCRREGFVPIGLGECRGQVHG